MPNWCSNSITITGPVDKIRDLYDNHVILDADDETGLLDGMYPMPKHLHETVSPSENGEDWYNWRVNNWSTKWEVSSEGLEFSDNGDGTAMITGWFDSAWAPPIGAYEHFTEQNPDCSVSASYYEPGMDFGGFWSTEHGDEYFEDLDARLKEPVESWDERFAAFEAEYDLLSEEWRFEDEEEDMVLDDEA